MEATFIIIREDLQVDPVTIVAEGLLVGRLPTCELLLNHPSVSRLHAGITSVEGDYYIRNLRRGNPIMLNGVPIEEYEALADGDVIGIGPFALNIHFVQGVLAISVSLQIAATAGDAVIRREASGVWDLPTTVHLELPSTPPEGEAAPAAHKKPPARKPKPAASSSKALDVFWDKRITSATKTVKPSPLFPLSGRPSGKAQSVWSPTTDLRRRWPVSLMLWGAIPIALLAVAGALFYASAFAPAPISDAHSRASMILTPPVANHANAGSCTSCHALKAGMQTQCVSCHFRRFAAHPEFALLRAKATEAPGLRFPHARHLDALAKEKGLRGDAACGECHERDAATRDFQPLDFDRHCASCHAAGGSLGAVEPLPEDDALPPAAIQALGVEGAWLTRTAEFENVRSTKPLRNRNALLPMWNF